MDYRGIAEGMPVHSADGQDLGRIVKCKPDSFVIEGGFFFPKDYEASYDAVVLVRNGEATLGAKGEDLMRTIH